MNRISSCTHLKTRWTEKFPSFKTKMPNREYLNINLNIIYNMHEQLTHMTMSTEKLAVYYISTGTDLNLEINKILSKCMSLTFEVSEVLKQIRNFLSTTYMTGPALLTGIVVSSAMSNSFDIDLKKSLRMLQFLRWVSLNYYIPKTIILSSTENVLSNWFSSQSALYKKSFFSVWSIIRIKLMSAG